MGALDYVSPDAKFAAAFLLVDPAVMLDDVMRIAIDADADLEQQISDMEAQLGFDFRADAAAAFGGEVAVAIDGPLLPVPSWKLVLEVHDPARVTWLLEQLAVMASEKLVAQGHEPIELTSEEVGGRTFWTLSGDKPFHFTFEESYLIAAPNRGLLDRAVRYKQSGYSLASAPRFRSLMPTDGSDNFSAVFYQDALSLLEPLAERIAAQDLTHDQRAALDAPASEGGPTLGYAYGEPERIVFAASGTMSLLEAGLPGLLGLGGNFDMDGIFRSIMTPDLDELTSES
jgi:hypothetical protein